MPGRMDKKKVLGTRKPRLLLEILQGNVEMSNWERRSLLEAGENEDCGNRQVLFLPQTDLTEFVCLDILLICTSLTRYSDTLQVHVEKGGVQGVVPLSFVGERALLSRLLLGGTCSTSIGRVKSSPRRYLESTR